MLGRYQGESGVGEKGGEGLGKSGRGEMVRKNGELRETTGVQR
jgi:hypothetical protein